MATSVYNFLGSKFKSFKLDGSINASGTVEFFTPTGTFATYKSTYTTSALTTANSNTITLDSAGEADIWLSGNYDVRIKDSSGTTLDTATNINPDVTETSVADNFIVNPSFEVDSSGDGTPDDWDITTYSGGTAAVDDTDRNHGEKSMKFVSTGNGGGTATNSDFFPVAASTTLYWSFDLKSTADVRNLVQMLWYDADQVALGSPTTDLYDDSTTNPTTWTSKVGSVAVPATAYFAKIKFYGAHSSDATAGTVRIDNVRLSVYPLTSHSATVSGDITFSGGAGAITMSASSINMAKGSNIADSATPAIGAALGNSVDVDGTTTITAFDTIQAGVERQVRFTGARTLTHNSTSLILPGSANITTANGDTARFVSLGSGNWYCASYNPISGRAVTTTNTNGHAFNGVIIQTGTISAVAEKDWTSLINSTYKFWEIEVYDVTATNSTATLNWRVSSDNGSTFEADASDYIYSAAVSASSGAAYQTIDSTSDASTLIRAARSLDNNAAFSHLVRIKLINPAGTATRRMYEFAGSYEHSAGRREAYSGFGHFTGDGSGDDIDAVRLFVSAGTFSGSYTVRAWN